MENSINKLRAAALIASAIVRELGENEDDFILCCDRYDDPTVSLIAAYETLDYREKDMIGMRLGFDYTNDYQPTEPHKYIDLATAYEMTTAQGASRVCHKAYRKIARMITEKQNGKETAI